MNNLYLDIFNLKNKIVGFKDAISKHRETLAEFYKKNNNVSEFWFDDNAEVYKEMLEKDFKNYFEQCDNITKQIDAIESFCEELETVFKLYLDINGLSSVRYSKSIVNNACSSLNESKQMIRAAESFVRNMHIPDEVGISDQIKNLLNDISVSEIDELLDKINGISTGVSKVLNNSKSEIAVLKISELDSNVCEYRYKY